MVAMKQRFLWALNPFEMTRKIQFVALLIGSSGVILWISTNIINKSEAKASPHNLAEKATRYRNGTSKANSTPSIKVFVRMAGKLKQHRTRFFCDFFRTAVLFWPASFGKTVEVLDNESEQDHFFANNLTSQVKRHFPNHKLEVAFQSLPKDASVLQFQGAQKTLG